MQSSEELVGKTSLPSRDLHTQFELNNGSKEQLLTADSDSYKDRPDWGQVTRRVTTDLETGTVIQDLNLEIAAAAAETVKKQMVRGIDLEVTLNPEGKRVDFANAAVRMAT